MITKRSMKIGGLLAVLLVGVLIAGGLHQASVHRRILAGTLIHQLEAHSPRITIILSNMHRSDVSVIEDQIYSELRTAPSTSLISRSMVTVKPGRDGRLECTVDVSQFGMSPYHVKQSR